MTDDETDEILERAKTDRKFREQLLSDPKEAFEDQGVEYDQAEVQSAIDRRDALRKYVTPSGGLQAIHELGVFSAGRRGR